MTLVRRKTCISAVLGKRALPGPSPGGPGSAPSAWMVVSCGVMLTCDAAGSVPVLMLQRSTPQPVAVIGSLSLSSPGATPWVQETQAAMTASARSREPMSSTSGQARREAHSARTDRADNSVGRCNQRVHIGAIDCRLHPDQRLGERVGKGARLSHPQVDACGRSQKALTRGTD